jgi:hypothetical protein
MLANTIIKAALRDLLVVESGGTPTANQYADGLEVLNDMIKNWSIQHNLVYENSREELSISGGVQSRTIGSTGQLVTTRPIDIISASLKYGDEEYPLEIIDINRYDSYSNKTIVNQPCKFYYRKTYPNGTLYFESTTDQAYTLILTSIKPLSQFTDGTTDNPLPEEYEYALKKNLPIELAAQMGASARVSQAMFVMADNSLSAIIGHSINLSPASIEIGVSGRFNIETDQ